MPKRTSTKDPNILDSIARYLSTTTPKYDYVTAAVYHKGNFLVSGNSDEDSRQSSLNKLQEVTERLAQTFTQNYIDVRLHLLNKVRLKDIKADILYKDHRFDVLCTKYQYKLNDSEKAWFEKYIDATATINAYQLLKELVKPKDKAKLKAEHWIQKNCTLEEISKVFFKNTPLSGYNNGLNDPNKQKLIEDQPKACNIIKKWFGEGHVPAANIESYIETWCNAAIIIRKLASKIQKFSSSEDTSSIKTLNDFSRPVIDVERIAKIYKSDGEQSQALREGKFKFVPPKDDSHAEMTILDKIFRDLYIGDEVYIGVSKLCCGCCYTVIRDFSKIIPGTKILVKGTHYKPYPDGWTPPEFLRAYPDIIFKLLRSGFELTSEFIKSVNGSTAVYESGDLSDYELDSVGNTCDYVT